MQQEERRRFVGDRGVGSNELVRGRQDNDWNCPHRDDRGSAIDRGGRLEDLTRARVRRVVIAVAVGMMGFVLLVRREGAGVSMKRRRTDVTQNHHYGEGDEEPAGRPRDCHLTEV